ncbi:phosphotransferase [Naumannella sp. ID2617S]|uniref:Phosphotransferase n=1 Tax=Enemella dayhoffiae TaxID=2016507 RepID=A0A255GQG4_9ACTN|nr:phosphotransferase [Enemella dayhoffiae]NNG18240.1 phosphotransferase [Naumannella sp. ID2617S]OYO18048.1 phosphotransferase [Enemella dayhoffiae]
MSATVQDPDGSRLLTTDQVAPLLAAAVSHAGGHLVSWQLDHVDANPNQSTTATYTAVVDWPFGRRNELLGVSARANGRTPTDERAEIFVDGDREAVVWLYPRDPDLPGLARAAYPEDMSRLLSGVMGVPVPPDRVRLDMIGYRPRRRAVLRATTDLVGPQGPYRTVFYVKVLRETLFEEVRRRHELLRGAGVPAPRVAAATPDCLLVLDELPGIPLSKAIFDPEPPCTAEQLIWVLDSMPRPVSELPRRAPWADSIQHYTEMVIKAMPTLEHRLRWLAEEISTGLAPIPPGHEPTHGDFHEGQIHVSGGQICGLLDVDTIGPGRRADDLACLVAHLSTVQRMNAQQAARVRHLLSTWVPVFDERVDPTELRLRAAAVVISLATGPYRGQEPNWQAETVGIVDAAETLVSQVL